MPTKSDLLRQLGWDDSLIKHFLIDDTAYEEKDRDNEKEVEIVDSNSITITYNAESSGNAAIVKVPKKK